MGPQERPPEEVIYDALDDLGRKLDTVAGAIAAVADAHTTVLDHLAGSEARRSHEAVEVSHRLEALERQVLNLGHGSGGAERPDLAHLAEVLAAMAAQVAVLNAKVDELAARPTMAPEADLTALHEQVAAAATRHDQDLALSLEVLAHMTEAFEKLEARTLETQNFTPVLARLDDVSASVRSMAGEVTNHTDVALIAVLRLVDQRLAALRSSLTGAVPPTAGSMGGFEAGAVMGATQAAWTRLEQRLDNEFDDLGRQLQGLASLAADVIAATEGLANRPVVTGDQFRKAASAMKDSVVSANRSRRERRGGPKGIDSG